MKAPFRETLWFKRGEFTESATGEEATVPLPIEDRYTDDGSICGTDSLRFGLHCGETRELPLDLDVAVEVVSVDTDLNALARELQHTHRRTVAALGSVFVVAAALIALL